MFFEINNNYIALELNNIIIFALREHWNKTIAI